MNEWMRELLFLPRQGSTLANDIDYLHYVVIGTTMAGAALVAVMTLYFIVRYRARSHGHDARPRIPRGALSRTFEVGVFGGLLTLFIAFWVVGFRQYVKLAEPPADSMTIYVTAKQWMWSFAYPNGTASNGVLYVPVGRPVRLVMTSRDVIHSFYVPAFRNKQDVVPGRSTVMWFEVKEPGHYPAYCAEYCGAGHSTMRAEVVALADSDYDRTLAGLTPSDVTTPQTLAQIGERVAGKLGCFRCHTPDGTPHIAPTFAGLYGAHIPLEGGGSVIADEAYLTSSMMDPAERVHAGFKPVMPSYQGLLGPGEVGALIEYLRSLRDVPRDRGSLPLPAAVRGDVPIVNPLGASR